MPVGTLYDDEGIVQLPAKDVLHGAILNFFQVQDGDVEVVASALTNLAVAFGDVLCGEPTTASVELVADETQSQILAELRKHTTLLEVLAKQGERTAWYRDQIGQWPMFLTPAEAAAGARRANTSADTGGLPG